MITMKKILKSYSISNCFHNKNEIFCDIEFIKKGRKCLYGNVVSVFDIETSSFYENDNKRGIMYAWVFGINGKCCRGRTWKEFIDLILELKEKYNLSLEKRLIIYVHNLAFEFQWLRKYFKWENVFFLDDRRPIYALSELGIEFRCSYILSGLSLEKVGENLLKYKVEKMVGDLDYSLIRHSKTPLNEKEWNYILNDGLVVMSYIQEEIERLGDITKLPLTHTGFVRDIFRKACLKGEDKFNFVALMKRLTMTVDDFIQLKRTFRGGFTHANINYVGKVVDNVFSIDFTSSYPSVMIAEKYPMSKAHSYVIKDEKDFMDMLKVYCCMFDCSFKNIRAKVDYENYISVSSCIKIEHYFLNNGRVIEAENLTISLTEQDFFIIAKLYKWDSMKVGNFKYFYKDYLPKDIILTILQLYGDKTSLKGVEGKEQEYQVSKGAINSAYGMAVTNPCRDDILYEDDIFVRKEGNIYELIDKYNKNRNRFLSYSWGIWVTAYARSNLFTGITEFKNDYIYSDTDSIKGINFEKHKKYIDDYNINVTKKIHKCLNHYGIPLELASPKTIKGIEKPLGVWDYEGNYSRFKTLGAKRYMYEIDNDIHITVAGVSKKSGSEYLKYKYKTNDKIFNAFEEGLYFPPHYIVKKDNKIEDKNGSGKLCHTYIDTATSGEVIDYLGNKNYYDELSSIHMENTDYTLGFDSEFRKLINGVKGGASLLK